MQFTLLIYPVIPVLNLLVVIKPVSQMTYNFIPAILIDGQASKSFYQVNYILIDRCQGLCIKKELLSSASYLTAKILDIGLVAFLMTKSIGMSVGGYFICLGFQTLLEVLIIPNKLSHILNTRFEY